MARSRPHRRCSALIGRCRPFPPTRTVMYGRPGQGNPLSSNLARPARTVTPLCLSDGHVSPAAAALRRRHSSPRPSPTKTQVTQYEINPSTASRPTKTSIALLARSPSPTEKSTQTLRLNPHKPTPSPAQNSPRFPPSRLFGRLPPRPPSRPCPAGVRKPLTKPAVRRTAMSATSPRYAAATGRVSSRACCAAAEVAGSPSPATCTVGKANLIPFSSKAFLIIA